MALVRLFLPAALWLAACGPTANPAPTFVGVSDQTAYVGSEIFLELQATDPDGEILRFDFASEVPGIAERGVLEPAGTGTSALFRWTPKASDVGVWLVDFQVTDGANIVTETVTLEVKPVSDGAPVFRRPLSAGATLDLTETDCLNLEVLIEDPDSSEVILSAEEPRIRGSELTQTSGTEGVWSWCPSPMQIQATDRYVLVLSADDGDNAEVLKHFLIVLRSQEAQPVDLGGYTVRQTGASCSISLPPGFSVEPGGMIVIGRDSGKTEFEDFWEVTLGPEVLYLNASDACPHINGGETFELLDADGGVVERPTPPLPEGSNAKRVSHLDPSDLATSWVVDDAQPAVASPGTATRDIGSGAVYLSEISDAEGSGNYVHEFIEIAVD